MLLLFHLDLSGRSNLNHAHATGQLGQPLLQFLTIVIAGGFANQDADLLNARLNGIRGAFSLNNRGEVLSSGHRAGTTKIRQSSIL